MSVKSSSDKSLVISPEIRIAKQDPLPDLKPMKVLRCKTCRHESNEASPILEQFRSNGLEGATWPRLYGDGVLPEGRQCKICPFAHRLGGYKVPLDQLLAQMKDNTDSTVEWYGVLKATIEMINTGKVKLDSRFRGSTRWWRLICYLLQNMFCESLGSSSRERLYKVIGFCKHMRLSLCSSFLG